MPNYKGIRRYERGIGAYLSKQFYEGFPENAGSQRKIVHLCYDQIWGNKKKIPVLQAKDIRINRTGKRIWNDPKLVDMLNDEQKLLLQHEAEFKRTGDIDNYGERAAIMLDSQYHKDVEFRCAYLNLINSQKYKNMQF